MSIVDPALLLKRFGEAEIDLERITRGSGVSSVSSYDDSAESAISLRYSIEDKDEQRV